LSIYTTTRREVIHMGSIEEMNLGADQQGEFFCAILPKLLKGETFLTEERIKGDRLYVWVDGSRGTILCAAMTDRGWKVREVN